MLLRSKGGGVTKVVFKPRREKMVSAKRVDVPLPLLHAQKGGDGTFPTSGLSALAGTDRATAARAAPAARDAVELVQGGAQAGTVRRPLLVP